MITTIAELAGFLLTHADLIEDLFGLIKAGVDKDLIKKSLRDVKVATTDAIVQQELGLNPVVPTYSAPQEGTQ